MHLLQNLESQQEQRYRYSPQYRPRLHPSQTSPVRLLSCRSHTNTFHPPHDKMREATMIPKKSGFVIADRYIKNAPNIREHVPINNASLKFRFTYLALPVSTLRDSHCIARISLCSLGNLSSLEMFRNLCTKSTYCMDNYSFFQPSGLTYPFASHPQVCSTFLAMTSLFQHESFT